MWNVNGWLCEKLGLTVESQTQECVPQIAKKDMFSKTLNMTIKEGMATGMSAVVTTKTKEGITLETQCIGKVYDETEFDRNEWTIEGEPNTTIVVEKPSTVELTCATVVNRIPDVINAKAGYVPTNEMDELKYRVKPLNEYVKDKDPDEFLIKSRNYYNKPICRKRAYEILKNLGEMFDVPYLGCHSMRKTFGYHYYKQTKDIALLQRMFNHSSPAITLHYIGIDQDRMNRAYKTFRYF